MYKLSDQAEYIPIETALRMRVKHMLSKFPAATPAMPSLMAFLKFFRWSMASDRNIPDIKDDLRLDRHRDRMECGGYNEAFIVQQWASFGPHF